MKTFIISSDKEIEGMVSATPSLVFLLLHPSANKYIRMRWQCQATYSTCEAAMTFSTYASMFGPVLSPITGMIGVGMTVTAPPPAKLA